MIFRQTLFLRAFTMIAIAVCNVACSMCQTPPDTSSRDKSDREEHADAPPPDSMVTFRWDLSENHVSCYRFHTVGKMTMGLPPGLDSMARSNRGRKPNHRLDSTRPDMEQMPMSVQATLKIVGEKGGKGRLVFEDIQMGMMGMNTPNGTIVLPGMSEQGPTESIKSFDDLRMILLFPSKPLAVGESQDIPVEVPFNYFGSQLTVKGTLHVAFTGYVEKGGRPCAELKSEFDVSEIELPPELNTKPSFSMRGSCISYFDPAEHRITEGEIHTEESMAGLMNTKVEATSSLVLCDDGK